MDRMIYTAMSGAKHVLNKQATSSNNLANVTSSGFKSQIDTFRAVPIIGDGLKTRAFVVDSTTATDFSQGPIQQTGRDLDVAIQGDGFISVQRADGSEAYTRNGAFKISENGLLQTSNGLTVLGDGGPISIPENVSVTIGGDGTVSVINNLPVPGPSNVLGRLKLVNPDQKGMVRAGDGLFVNADGTTAQADALVKVAGGFVEGSNVSVVNELVTMIGLGRQFELQMKVIQTAKENDERATQLLSLNS